jgi:hypothetical protein
MRVVAVSADHGRVDIVVDAIGTGEVPRRARLDLTLVGESAL